LELQHLKSRNKLVNLPLLRNRTEIKKVFKNKPKSLLLDIEQSLLIINKKRSQERSYDRSRIEDRKEIKKRKKR